VDAKGRKPAPASRDSAEPRRQASPPGPDWRRLSLRLTQSVLDLGDDAPLLLVCAALVLFGCALRVQNLGFPDSVVFDEKLFVGSAREYLNRLPDSNDHPPLGKLLIALGMHCWGDNSLGWRIMPLGFGIANVVLAHLLGQRVFRNPVAGWLAGAFVAADGFLVSYSRVAMLDGMLTTCILACALAAVRAKSPLRILAAAALAGCAMSIKFSGVAALLGVWMTIASQRGWRRSAVLGGGTLLACVSTYTALHALGLWVSDLPAGVDDVWRTTCRLIAGHSRITTFHHPASSHWYTWVIPLKPIILREHGADHLMARMLTSLGNPLLWWTSTAAACALAAWLFWMGPQQALARLREPEPASAAGPVQAQFRGVVQLFAFWLGMLSPWIVLPRQSYVYHYLPSYACGLVLLAGLVAWVHARRAWLPLVFVLLVANVSVIYAPLWGQIPISEEGAHRRLWLDTWRR
jgi:dolichyl-phosphate-mannose-protein mannosyltransferase